MAKTSREMTESLLNHPAAARQSITDLAKLSRSGRTVQGTSIIPFFVLQFLRRLGIRNTQCTDRHTGPDKGSGGLWLLAIAVNASRKGLIFADLFLPTNQRPSLVRRICEDD